MCDFAILYLLTPRKVTEAGGEKHSREKERSVCVCGVLTIGNGGSIPRRGPIPSICAAQDKLWLGTGVRL